jgi:aldose 1-epimerase
MTAPFADAVRALPQVRLSRKSGINLTLTALGARMTELWVPDQAGRLADVVLGHDRAEDYLTPHGYIGATCGRYGNRIAGGKFMLDGVEVALDQNEGANHLHGGGFGFDGKSGRSRSRRKIRSALP